jgi:UDP-glucose 6-dehydrogenase
MNPSITRPAVAEPASGAVRRGPVAIVEASPLGLAAALWLTECGQAVTVLDADPVRVGALRAGEVEPAEAAAGWAAPLASAIAAGRFEATVYAADALAEAEVVVVAVEAAFGADGRPDIRALERMLAAIAPELAPDAVVAVLTPIPLGREKRLQSLIGPTARLALAAWEDGAAARPREVVLGAPDEQTAATLLEVFTPWGSAVRVWPMPEAALAGAWMAARRQLGHICA